MVKLRDGEELKEVILGFGLGMDTGTIDASQNSLLTYERMKLKLEGKMEGQTVNILSSKKMGVDLSQFGILTESIKKKSDSSLFQSDSSLFQSDSSLFQQQSQEEEEVKEEKESTQPDLFTPFNGTDKMTADSIQLEIEKLTAMKNKMESGNNMEEEKEELKNGSHHQQSSSSSNHISNLFNDSMFSKDDTKEEDTKENGSFGGGNFSGSSGSNPFSKLYNLRK